MDEGVLKQIGLGDNEIKIYITLLKLGPSPVGRIAERSGMYRPYVYDTLDRLLEKGLASYVVEGGKKSFEAAHPEALLRYLDERKDGLQKIMPDLLGVMSKREEGIKVEIVKGKRVVQTILNDVYATLNPGGEVLILGVDERKFMEHAPVPLELHIARLEKKPVYERMIAMEGSDYFPGGKTSDYRFVPERYSNPTPTYVYGDKVAMILWSTPLLAIMVESKELADSYRKYFNLIWSVAKRIDWRRINTYGQERKMKKKKGRPKGRD